jgi:hypothetical protein
MKTIANADRFDAATTSPRVPRNQPADHGTTPDHGPGTEDEGGSVALNPGPMPGMKDEPDKTKG